MCIIMKDIFLIAIWIFFAFYLVITVILLLRKKYKSTILLSLLSIAFLSILLLINRVYFYKTSTNTGNINADINTTISVDDEITDNFDFSINYEWYKTEKVYIREDGQKAIVLDCNNDNYIRFVFNDGFTLTENNIKGDELTDNEIIYEVVIGKNYERPDKIKLIYNFKDDFIEVIDTEYNGFSHSGFFFSSGISEPPSVNYCWYKDKIYTGGKDNLTSFRIIRSEDGFFKFLFNDNKGWGTNTISDTVIKDAIVYNYLNDLEIIYYYKEDKIEVKNKINSKDYRNGFYYSSYLSHTNEKSDENNLLQWYREEKVFVREDGLHTFSMGWLDSEYFEFVFDGGTVVGGTYDVDASKMKDALLYFDSYSNIEIIFFYNEDKIKVNDLDYDSENYSGDYYYVKNIFNKFTETMNVENPDNINYEWYLNSQYIRDDSTIFTLDYLDDGYLYFIFNNRSAMEDTHGVDTFSISNGLLYEGYKMYVIYYYSDDVVQVIDSKLDDMNLSGFYYYK